MPCHDGLPCAFEAVLDSTLFVTLQRNIPLYTAQKVDLLILFTREPRGFPICNEFKGLMINSHADEALRKPEMYLFGGYAEIPKMRSPWASPGRRRGAPALGAWRLRVLP